MTIGVVVPVYRQIRSYVFECFAALEAQEFRDFKVAVVLDGAGAETERAVREAVRRLTVPYEVIRRTKNMGFAHSLNEGFERLRDCPYITWVSSDDRPLPHYLGRLHRAMLQAPPETVIVYSLYHHIDERGRRLQKPASHHDLMCGFMRRRKEEIMQVNFIGVSHLFKREAYVRAGKYDPARGMVADHEFWMRLLRAGEILFLPEYLFEYRLNGVYSNTTVTPEEKLHLDSMRASRDIRRRFGDIPKATVILTAHNHERFVKRAVDSVLGQTLRDFHLVVIDDASSDRTYPIVYRCHDPRMMPVRLTSRRGKAAALGIGLELALGEYVLELDGDDWLDPQALALLVREMERQPPEVAAVYANQKIWHLETNGAWREGPILRGGPLRSKYEVLTRTVMPCPRLYRKQALERIGGFPAKIAGQPCLPVDYLTMLLLAERYRFRWLDAPVYHRSVHGAAHGQIHKRDYAAQRRLIVRHMLERWNSPYIPEFVEENGELTGLRLL